MWLRKQTQVCMGARSESCHFCVVGWNCSTEPQYEACRLGIFLKAECPIDVRNDQRKSLKTCD